MTFKPMLAVNTKTDQIHENALLSIKLEGVRGEFHPEEGLLSRQLKPINNELFYERFASIEKYCAHYGIVLEGEFYLHGWTFNRIDSAVRGNGNIDANQLEFHVFDCFVMDDPDLDFRSRYERYKQAVMEIQQWCPYVKAVDQFPFTTPEAATQAYAWAIENGYEGICTKRADLPYKHGRSTLKQGYFTRLKPEDPYDCVVLDIIERQHNLCESEVNELGYLKKKQDKDMKQGAGIAQTAVVYTPAINKVHKVSLTRNLTDVDRAFIWDNKGDHTGMVMKFVGIPVSGQAVPRSPRFDGWRGDIEPLCLVHDESDCICITFDHAHFDEMDAGGAVPIKFAQVKDYLERGYTLGDI